MGQQHHLGPGCCHTILLTAVSILFPRAFLGRPAWRGSFKVKLLPLSCSRCGEKKASRRDVLYSRVPLQQTGKQFETVVHRGEPDTAPGLQDQKPGKVQVFSTTKTQGSWQIPLIQTPRAGVKSVAQPCLLPHQRHSPIFSSLPAAPHISFLYSSPHVFMSVLTLDPLPASTLSRGCYHRVSL